MLHRFQGTHDRAPPISGGLRSGPVAKVNNAKWTSATLFATGESSLVYLPYSTSREASAYLSHSLSLCTYGRIQRYRQEDRYERPGDDVLSGDAIRHMLGSSPEQAQTC